MRSRMLSIWLLLTVAAVRASAQMGNLQIPTVEYNPVLLLNPKVKQELKLSEKAAGETQQAIMEEGMKILPAMSQGAPNSGQPPMSTAQRLKVMTKGVETMQARIVKVLTPAQRTRLRQLTLQSIGPSAVLQPKVAKSLGLSKTQLSTLMLDISKANQTLGQGMAKPATTNDWQVRMKQMEALQKKSAALGNQALAKTLTPAQKAKWKAMLGKPMDLGGFMGIGAGLGMFGQ